MRKILAVQPNGPYTIGGFCLGGILAYEIVSQLRAAGRKISLVVLLDPLNPLYLPSCDSLMEKLSYIRYVGKRATRLGFGPSLVHVREHLRRRFSRTVGLKSARTEVRIVQETVEGAAVVYKPGNYEGRVLLLLPSERPPHVNSLPAWQSLISGKLNTLYVDGHHRDLLAEKCVRSVAAAINSQLTPAAGDTPLALPGDISGSAPRLKMRKSSGA
jgi:prepilin-type processing-associated H-X9-DG protein